MSKYPDIFWAHSHHVSPSFPVFTFLFIFSPLLLFAAKSPDSLYRFGDITFWAAEWKRFGINKLIRVQHQTVSHPIQWLL